MEDGVLVHVLDGFKKLVDVALDSGLTQVVHSTFDGLIHIHFHDFKYKGQTACGFIEQNFDELDDVGVGLQSIKSLNLSQIIDLLYRVEY